MRTYSKQTGSSMARYILTCAVFVIPLCVMFVCVWVVFIAQTVALDTGPSTVESVFTVELGSRVSLDASNWGYEKSDVREVNSELLINDLKYEVVDIDGVSYVQTKGLTYLDVGSYNVEIMDKSNVINRVRLMVLDTTKPEVICPGGVITLEQYSEGIDILDYIHGKDLDCDSVLYVEVPNFSIDVAQAYNAKVVAADSSGNTETSYIIIDVVNQDIAEQDLGALTRDKNGVLHISQRTREKIEAGKIKEPVNEVEDISTEYTITHKELAITQEEITAMEDVISHVKNVGGNDG